MPPETRHYQTWSRLIQDGASLTVVFANARVAAKGRFSWVLAGGNTPRDLYRLLAQPPFVEQMPWAHSHIFWGDERCVRHDDPQSNFAMAQAAMLAHVPIPKKNVHRLVCESHPPAECARAYERSLSEFFKDETPSFDLLNLGVGSDGHTASLFPRHPALDQKDHWVIDIPRAPAAPKLPRVSLTLPIINQAKVILFLAKGQNKKRRIEEILENSGDPNHPLPAARVKALEKTIWLLHWPAVPGEDSPELQDHFME